MGVGRGRRGGDSGGGGRGTLNARLETILLILCIKFQVKTETEISKNT